MLIGKMPGGIFTLSQVRRMRVWIVLIAFKFLGRELEGFFILYVREDGELGAAKIQPPSRSKERKRRS